MQGGVEAPCDTEVACSLLYTDSFRIDWLSKYSFHNWMTNLDLICEEPYKIGMIGVLSFIGFSVGSILITPLSDKFGRRKTLLCVSMVTPIGIVICILVEDNLYAIYSVIFLMGLTYNCRASTAYVFATEFLTTSYHLVFAQMLFLLGGLFYILSGVHFYLFRD